LKDSYQALERECPPGVNWTEKNKVIKDMEGSMVVWSKGK